MARLGGAEGRLERRAAGEWAVWERLKQGSERKFPCESELRQGGLHGSVMKGHFVGGG